jgi:CBS domain-containing protein
MANAMNAAQPQTEVRQVMTRQVEAAHLHESLDTALDRMIVRGVSVLPVVDGDELVGLIAAADIRRHAATTDEAKVSDVATLGAFHCYEHDAAADAAMTMEKLNVPWLAVLNADHGLVGMVAEGDVRPASSKESHARPIEQTQGADEPTEENPGLRVYSDRPRLKR